MATIQHTAFFKLKHIAGSAAETRFLELALGLARIPGVHKLECVKQISQKNHFAWGLLMGFDSQADYERYNAHPDHLRFVAEHWVPEVEQFMELDYTARG